MLVVGATPSGGVIWFALSREAKSGGPPTIPPAWAFPGSGSRSRPPRLKLTSWRFDAVSVKPSLYDQSCMRLCIANKFAVAASMSLRCAVEKFVGLHASLNHWFVHG